MFYNKTKKEITNNIFKIIIVLLVDLFWIVGLYLVFKPLVTMALVYTLFSLSMIYPRYILIRFMRNLNLIYVKDKKRVRSMLQCEIDDLQFVVLNKTEHSKIHRINPDGMERTIRKHSNRNIKQYNLYIILRDIVEKDLVESKN